MNRFHPPDSIGLSRLRLTLLAVALTPALALPARAEEPPPIDMSEAGDGSGAAAAAATSEPIAYPKAFNDRPLTAPEGLILVNVDAGIGLSKGSLFKPVYLTPDVYYGVNPDLTVGLVHHSLIGYPFGGGLCFGGLTSGCPSGSVYENFSLDLLYSLMKEKDLAAAAHGGFDFWSLDPFFMSLRVGVAVKYLSGALGVLADPYVYLGLNSRTGGNKDGLGLPIRVGFQANDSLNVGVVTGIWGPFDGFSDYLVVPLGVGGLYSLTSKMEFGGQFIFLRLLGGNSSADYRGLVLSFNYRI